MDENYARLYRDLYLRHWWWRAREGCVLAFLDRMALPRPARLLDVGCGDGLLFDRLSHLGEVEGLEPDLGIVRPETLRSSTIHQRPFDETFRPPRPFDCILMLDVVEHLDAPVAALAHAHSLLAPGGRLLITVPAFQWLWTGHDDFNQHRKRYDAATMRRELEQAGLSIDEMRYLFFWPVLGKLAVRLRERWSRTEPAPARIPPAWLNRLLLAVTRVDLAIGRRLPLPWGSSLLVTAHRADRANRADAVGSA